MTEEKVPSGSSLSKKNFTVYLKLLYRWRKFLIQHIIIIAFFSVLITLIIPQTYTSTATILPESSQNLANMILPQKMTEGLGGAIGALTGNASNQTNTIMSILKSRDMAVAAIDRFDLMERFETEMLEDAIEAYREMVFVTIDDEQMVRISVDAKTEYFNFQENIDETRNFVHELATFIIEELDRKFTNLKSEKATFERKLVEQRFIQNQDDLRKSEEALMEFSKKNSMIALPQQVEATVETAARLEAQIIADEIELAAMLQASSPLRPEVKQKQIRIDEAENKLKSIKLFGSSQDSLKLLPSFETAPELILEYARLQRELSVQSLLYEFLIQQYEQLKIMEAQQTPSLQFIDRPAIPTKRTSPTRSILAIILFIIGSVFGLIYIMSYELYYSKYKKLVNESIREVKSEE